MEVVECGGGVWRWYSADSVMRYDGIVSNLVLHVQEEHSIPVDCHQALGRYIWAGDSLQIVKHALNHTHPLDLT